jgi:hypothetical protein
MLETFFPLSQRNGDCAKIWSPVGAAAIGVPVFRNPPAPQKKGRYFVPGGRTSRHRRLWASTIGWPSGATGRVIISDEGSRGVPPCRRPAGVGGAAARGMLKPIVWWPAVTTARRRTPRRARSRHFMASPRRKADDRKNLAAGIEEMLLLWEVGLLPATRICESMCLPHIRPHSTAVRGRSGAHCELSLQACSIARRWAGAVWRIAGFSIRVDKRLRPHMPPCRPSACNGRGSRV